MGMRRDGPAYFQETIMAQNQQHGEQSIGSGSDSGTAQDGIQGTPSGTEGATSGQGMEKGQSKQSARDLERNAGKNMEKTPGQNPGNRQGSGGTETYQRNDLFQDDGENARMDEQQRSDSQQSAQREGMGSHQHGEKRNTRLGTDVERGDEDPGNLHSDKDPDRER
jgi:hypothetical protein